ncbi:MAG: AbrB/MazE/SpoVT family DNA-binding domain-containing protein [Actinomycetota bacterium]|nr:AbrB/MazE/SpoVT family DNA-binding domain-containing protein [Actinomycetota bacterium]
MNTTIDKAGRVVIPKPMREALGLLEGGEVELAEEDGRIIISPRAVAKQLVERDGVLVCVASDPVPPLTALDVREVLDSVRR